MPDGLVVGISTQGDGLHVVAGHGPGHAAQLYKAGDEATQQRLFPHVLREAYEHPAAVLEAGGKEVAGLSGQGCLGEAEVAYFAPVDL